MRTAIRGVTMRSLIPLIFLTFLFGCLQKADTVPATIDQDTQASEDAQFAAHQGRQQCGICHEFERLTEDHYPDQDCYGCHSYPTWDPSGATSADGATTFSHEPTPDSCVACHEQDRLNASHFAGQDCASCHAYPDWSETTL